MGVVHLEPLKIVTILDPHILDRLTSVHFEQLDSCRSSNMNRRGYTQRALEDPADKSPATGGPPTCTQALYDCYWWENYSLMLLQVHSRKRRPHLSNLHCHTNIADWADHKCRYWMSSHLCNCNAKWDRYLYERRNDDQIEFVYSVSWGNLKIRDFACIHGHKTQRDVAIRGNIQHRSLAGHLKTALNIVILNYKAKI